jgi:hypothetical protein
MRTSLHSLCAPKSSAITIFIRKILSSIYIQKGTIYNINKVKNHLFYTISKYNHFKTCYNTYRTTNHLAVETALHLQPFSHPKSRITTVLNWKINTLLKLLYLLIKQINNYWYVLFTCARSLGCHEAPRFPNHQSQEMCNEVCLSRK